jgi:LPS export ABC transporter protein LptC
MRLQESLPRLTLLAGLAGVAAMVGYVTLFWDSSQPAALLRSAGVAVDFTVEQPRGIVYDERGTVVRRFQAERLVHYRADDRAELEQPRFEAIGNDGTVWSGAGRDGSLWGDDRLELRGAVSIVDAAATTRLDTERLQWQADTQLVSTDVAVRLIKDTHTVTAVGLRADLGRDRVELLQQVEGTHVIR